MNTAELPRVVLQEAAVVGKGRPGANSDRVCVRHSCQGLQWLGSTHARAADPALGAAPPLERARCYSWPRRAPRLAIGGSG
jgi:hypothetical protein